MNKNIHNIKIKASNQNCKIYKNNETDSGYDLKANLDRESIVIPPNTRTTINTGIVLELPAELEAVIRPRSGLAQNKGITVLNSPGTIDSGYRGEIKVILINLGHNDVTINKYDKIAQIIFQEKTYTHIIYTENISENTTRGINGFGSSDK